MNIDPTPLALQIAEEIGDGRIPFTHFMERALYDPDHGYYMRPLPPEPRERDYYTSPDVGEVFGRCLARQFAEMWKVLGEPENFHVIELGAGRGLLCGDVCRHLESDAPDCMSRTTYIAVERSPARLSTLLEGIESEKLNQGDRITWLDSVGALPSRITGVIYSNEFFDALPVHRVCPLDGRFLEVYVRARNAEFFEELDAPSTVELQRYFDRLAISFDGGKDGDRAEVNLCAVAIMETIGKKLDRGFVLTLDYGYPAGELFSARRIAGGGMLMCYHRHRAHADAYIHVGEQDMTAHVDFSSLTLAGMDTGLHAVGFTDQHHALVGLGIARELSPLVESAERDQLGGLYRNLAIKNLLLPGGLGGTLKVLLQEKGVGAEKAKGLSAIQSPLYQVRELFSQRIEGSD